MNCKKENILSWKSEGVKLGLIDIREFYESPEINDSEVINVPMGELLSYDFNVETTYVLICGTGRRATAAVMEIARIKPEVKVYVLDGGAEAYLA
jgi:rhodanese-related sulfurtransferase